MKVDLKQNERVDDLQIKGYQIIQNPEKFGKSKSKTKKSKKKDYKKYLDENVEIKPQ